MMAEEAKRVVGVFNSRAAADTCFNALLDRGVSAGDVAVMMSEATRARDYHHESDDTAKGSEAGSMAAEAAGVGGAVGLGVGATIAAIAAAGTTLVIPGLNLIVAGPIVAALAGAGAGAFTGGLVGTLVGLGIPEQDAQVYNRALSEGGVVMSVTAQPDADVIALKDCLLSNGAQQVAVY